jgi:ABC-type sulfate transport system substrate-binding protein
VPGSSALLAAFVVGIAAPVVSLAAAEDVLRVRSSAIAAPCVEAVGQAWEARGGRSVSVETGGPRDRGAWDVLVGSGVELTRALEGGEADLATDVDIATIPWVLHLPSGGDVSTLSDLARSNVEIVMPAGAASYEARRALAEQGAARVLETTDTARLRSAPVALVPLSLAGPGKRVSVDIPPIRVSAALGMRARHSVDAAAFVSYLGSEDGQQVFATCSAQ